MSLPTRATVEIFVTKGDLTGTDAIKQNIHNIINAALKQAVNNVITKMIEVVPDSSPRVLAGGYPPSYVSENLSSSSQKILRDSVEAIGSSLQRRYSLKYGYPASYARFVDVMRSVQWSTAGTHGGFIKEVRDFLIAEVKRLLAIGLNSAQANKIDATKYIGTQRYKKRVGGVKSRAGPSPGDNRVFGAN